MSYRLRHPINGQGFVFMDGCVVIPHDLDLDDKVTLENLKAAQRATVVIDAYARLGDYVEYPLHKSFSRFDDEPLTLIAHFGQILTDQNLIRVPSNYYEYCAGAQLELERRRELDELKKKREARRKQPTRSGYVYLLRSSNGFYKIGRTVDPDDRIATFSVKLPFDVEYEHVISCSDMYELETRLHVHFAFKRVNGEWFDLSPDDIAYIKSLGGAS